MAATMVGALLLSIAVVGTAAAPLSAPYSPTWPSITKHGVPKWFNDAKFGMYAHWGPYSVPAFGNEWYSRNMYINGSSTWKHHVATWGETFGYKDFIPLFSAEHFNATAWAALYKKSGARYAGPVAEHADGYAMWPTKYSHFNAGETGPKRDVVKELTDAIRAQGLRVITTLHHQWLWAWYPTWNNVTDCANPAYELNAGHGGLYGPKVSGPSEFSHPNCTQQFMDYHVNKAKELVDNYQPDLVYYDSKWGIIDEAHRLDFVSYYYNAAAALGKEVAVTYKNSDLEPGSGVLDFERGGAGDITSPAWQTDDAVGRNSWSWVNPADLKNSSELVGELVDIVSKNGSFLLDMPPFANGSVAAEVEATLSEMGEWLEVNGEAIFNSRPWVTYGEGPTRIIPGGFHEWPVFTNHDFRFTVSGNVLFVTAMAWSPSGYRVLSLNSTSPGTAGKIISSVSLVGSDETLQWARTASALVIGPLHRHPDTPSIITAVVFRVTFDNTRVGFLTFDVLPPATPGTSANITWKSLRAAADDSNKLPDVELDFRALGRGGMVLVENSSVTVPNTGLFIWDVPTSLAAADTVHITLRHQGEGLDDSTWLSLVS